MQVLLALVSHSSGLPTGHVYQWRNLGSRGTPLGNYYGAPAQVRVAANPSLSANSLLRSETDKTFRLVTELAELGAKHVVSAVVDLPNLDPGKKLQFESTGLTGLTSEDTKQLNSLLRELGDLGATASTSLAANAQVLARRAGLSRRKAEQISKFAKLVPLLAGLTNLGAETSTASKSGSAASGLEVLESIGLDLESGLTFLKENNLDISDGLALLGGLSGNDDGASLKSLTSISQLLGIGSFSLGASGGASTIEVVETPELKAKLDETNELLTELAGLGATYVVAALAELPGLPAEKQRRYKRVGDISQREKDRLNSLLVELGELGAEASIAAAEAGANVPGLAKLAKLVPILRDLADLASVSDYEDSEANLAATRAVFSSPSLNRAANPYYRQSTGGFVHPSAISKVLTPELKAQTEKTIKLVTELAEFGTKYVVSAVADLPDVDPKKRALFEEIGLVGITEKEKASLNSVLQQLGELGSDASISVAEAAASVARSAGLGRKKAAQIAKFTKLVPILKGLTDLASDTVTAEPSKPADVDDTQQLLGTIGLDLETGLEFLKKNNLEISDGLQLLDAVVGGEAGSFSFSGLAEASKLLGVGALSLGATGSAEAINSLETPRLRSQLDETNKLLTELAEIGAVYAVSATARLPTISLEKRKLYRKVGQVGEKEKERLNSILVKLGELGSNVSTSLTKVGAEIPGLANLAKLVPILTTLAELSFVSNSEDAQANLDATKNIFSSGSQSGRFVSGSNSHCKNHPCIVHARRENFGSAPRNFPFQLNRFVHF